MLTQHSFDMSLAKFKVAYEFTPASKMALGSG
jgi:hypothetical protein